ncbi:hypothetical protein C0J52_14688 [Blattella germanica]|nr:hypothetical protein C0J52_14688 [Blattella germanica]
MIQTHSHESGDYMPATRSPALDIYDITANKEMSKWNRVTVVFINQSLLLSPPLDLKLLQFPRLSIS